MSPTAFVTFAMVGAILAGTVVGLVEIARHTIAGIQRRADEPIPYLPISDGVKALRRNQVAVRKAAGRHRDADDTAPIPPLSSTDAWEQR